MHRNETPEPIGTKISHSIRHLRRNHLHKLWWRSVKWVWLACGEIFPFPIGFHRRPYNTLALCASAWYSKQQNQAPRPRSWPSRGDWPAPWRRPSWHRPPRHRRTGQAGWGRGHTATAPHGLPCPACEPHQSTYTQTSAAVRRSFNGRSCQLQTWWKLSPWEAKRVVYFLGQ